MALGAVLSFFFGVFAALAVLLYQVIIWLKTGQWPTLTLVELFFPITSGFPFWAWLAEPTSWYGLHKVVRFLSGLPLWLWFILGGTVTSGIFMKRLEEEQTHQAKIEAQRKSN